MRMYYMFNYIYILKCGMLEDKGDIKLDFCVDFIFLWLGVYSVIRISFI